MGLGAFLDADCNIFRCACFYEYPSYPGIDGGHALFCIYEIITGRKPTDKFMEYAQMVGMVLLLGLMAYALGLDIFRMFK